MTRGLTLAAVTLGLALGTLLAPPQRAQATMPHRHPR